MKLYKNIFLDRSSFVTLTPVDFAWLLRLLGICEHPKTRILWCLEVEEF